jgi:hypothetical protein
MSNHFPPLSSSLLKMNRNGWNRPQLALAAAQKYQPDRQQLPIGGGGGGIGGLVSDLLGSGSGGHGSYSGGGYGSNPGSCFSIDICPDIILAVIAAAAAAAVFLLYTTITAERKKRSSDSGPWGGLADFLNLDMADFLNLGRTIIYSFVLKKNARSEE